MQIIFFVFASLMLAATVRARLKGKDPTEKSSILVR